MSAILSEQPVSNNSALRIIRSTEPIEVQHPITLIYGQPGIGKSSLFFSADNSVLLNFDSESALARTVNRGDAIDVLTTVKLRALMEHPEILDPFATIGIDTAGRAVEVMSQLIIEDNPKCGQADGSLTLKGFGSLKQSFNSWTGKLRAMGKDLVFISHQKEDKNGDTVFVRPDITGGSKDTMLRLADFVGYLYMNGKHRVLDFNPTEAWFGKNPACWAPFKVPPPEKATAFLAKLLADGKASLGKVSEASAIVARQVEEWRQQIQTFRTPHEFNRAIPEIQKLAPAPLAQVKKVLIERANVLQMTFDKATNQFVGPEPQPQAVVTESFI